MRALLLLLACITTTPEPPQDVYLREWEARTHTKCILREPETVYTNLYKMWCGHAYIEFIIHDGEPILVTHAP